MPSMSVAGLRAAAKNLALIGKVGSTELSRDALREGARVVSRAAAAGTYQNFIMRTGAIRFGFGVRVAKELKGEELAAFVVQRETALALRPTKKRSRKPKPTKGVAYWWRYLEFGTTGRKTAKTPKFLRKAKVSKSPRVLARQSKALARYTAAKSQGDIKARNWIRPAFAANAPGAVDTFGANFRRRVEAAVNSLSKT
jgi:HK97 gp10 family phage protein